MNVQSFIADSAPEAVEQIRAKLGPEAVVLNVRQLSSQGLSRLWQKPRIEVLAYVPETPSQPDLLGDLRQEIASLKQQIPTRKEEQLPAPAPTRAIPDLLSFDSPTTPKVRSNSRWQVQPILENLGFLPVTIQRIIDVLEERHGSRRTPSLAEELKWTRAAIAALWPTPSGPDGGTAPFSGLHIFVGPAGSGKTTVLCKWLAQAVLMENRLAHVWRLDGRSANTAESLSVYGEILGVPVDRIWDGTHLGLIDIGFIDVPGVNWLDSSAVAETGQQLARFPTAQVHLVLNAAYETSLLLSQVRAFSALPIADLIITHLDEETRWGKICSLSLGTKYSLRFLSAGQNIPGEFSAASAETILSRIFPGK